MIIGNVLIEQTSSDSIQFYLFFFFLSQTIVHWTRQLNSIYAMISISSACNYCQRNLIRSIINIYMKKEIIFFNGGF